MPLYNIFNPTLAPRIIYDGSPEQKAIWVPPGETKNNVELADHVAEALIKTAEKVGKRNEVVLEVVGADEAKPTPKKKRARLDE